MPRIPLPAPAQVQQISAEVGAPQARAGGGSFGAQVGEAVSNLGQNITGFGEAVGGYFAKQQAGNDAKTVADWTATHSYVPQYNKNLTEADPNGGFTQTTIDDGQAWVKQQDDDFAKANPGASAAARRQVHLDNMNQLQQHVNNAANTETKLKNDNGVLNIGKAIDQQVNDVLTGGQISKDNFEIAVTKTHRSIDTTPGLDEEQKKELYHSADQRLVAARFQAALDAAEKSGDPKAVDAVIAELKDPFYSKLFEPSALETKQKQLAQTSSRGHELALNNAADGFINRIRADPSTYEENAKKALDAINKDPSLVGNDKTAMIQAVKSNAAAMRFESFGEQATTVEEIDKRIAELKDPKAGWVNEFTDNGYTAELNSLLQRKQNIQAGLNSTATKLFEARGKVLTRAEQELAVTAKNLHEQSLKAPISDADIQNLKNKALVLASERQARGEFGISPELQNTIDETLTQREVYRKANGQPNSHTVALENAVRSQTDKKWQFGTSGNLPGGRGKAHAFFKTDDGVEVRVNIGDHTHMSGMQPRAYTILSGMTSVAKANGIVRLEIVAANGPGHKSHGKGTEFDVVGYHADNSVWTDAERVTIADGGRAASANRFGFYTGGSHRNVLHIGYAHTGYGPAIWGANGLTGGDASRQFSDPATQKFTNDFYGGKMPVNKDSAIVPGGVVAPYNARPVSYYMPTYRGAIGKLETGGQDQPYTYGGYQGDPDPHLGRYGIATSNLAQWSKAALGREVTPREFLADPKIQDAIFDHRFGIYVRKYGPEGAARAWLGGEGNAHNDGAKDKKTGITTGDYGRKFTELTGGAGGDGYDSSSGDPAGEGYNHTSAIQLSAIQTVRDNNNRDMSQDFIGFAAKNAGGSGIPLMGLDTQAGFDQRAQLYENAKATYQPTAAQATPFQPGEMSNINTLLNSGNNAAIAAFYASMARWPSDMKADALRQMSQTNPFGAVAGQMMADGNSAGAMSAMRGDAHLKEMGEPPVWKAAADKALVSAQGLGDILRGVPNAAGIRQALYGQYADKYGTSNPYDQAAMDQLAEKLMGGAFGIVNGTRTLMPQDTTQDQFSQFMEVADWQKVSMTHTPPVGQAENGKDMPMSAADMANMHPINVGGNAYSFVNDEGNFVMTRDDQGNPQTYFAVLDKQTVEEATMHTEPSPGVVAPAAGLGITAPIAGQSPEAAASAAEAEAARTGKIPPEPTPTPTPAAPPAPTPALTPQALADIDRYTKIYEDAMRRAGAKPDVIKNATDAHRKELTDYYLKHH